MKIEMKSSSSALTFAVAKRILVIYVCFSILFQCSISWLYLGVYSVSPLMRNYRILEIYAEMCVCLRRGRSLL